MATTEEDFYKLLGIEKDATMQEIKRAYRAKALIHAPDKNANSKESVRMMQQINVAYERLSDAKERRDYDEDDLFRQFDDDQDASPIIPGHVPAITSDEEAFSEKYRRMFLELSTKHLVDTTEYTPCMAGYKIFSSGLYKLTDDLYVHL